MSHNEKRYILLQLNLHGKVYGRRRPGRRRISWHRNLRKWFNMTTTGLFGAAASKVGIAMLVANIRNEYAPQEEGRLEQSSIYRWRITEPSVNSGPYLSVS